MGIQGPRASICNNSPGNAESYAAVVRARTVMLVRDVVGCRDVHKSKKNATEISLPRGAHMRLLIILYVMHWMIIFVFWILKGTVLFF